MESQSEKLRRYAKIVLFVGVPVSLIGPFLLTRALTSVSFANTGQIGDTIGGLTAPVIGLMGAILVYLALLSQVEANETIQKQISNQKQADDEQKHFDGLFAVYRQVRADLDAVEFIKSEKTRMAWDSPNSTNLLTYSGVQGIQRSLAFAAKIHHGNLGKETQSKFNPEFIWIGNCLEILVSLINRVDSAKLHPLDKETLASLINHLFQSRIVSLSPTECPSCTSLHEVYPKEFMDLLYTLDTNINKISS